MTSFISMLCLLILSSLMPVQVEASALRSIPEENLKYPVMVTVGDGTLASGFYLNVSDQALYFVTARHVLFSEIIPKKLRHARAYLISYAKESDAAAMVEIALDLSKLDESGHVLFHQNHDVALIKIGNMEARGNTTVTRFVEGVMKKASEDGRIQTLLTVSLEATKTYEETILGNDIFVFGYPASLGIRAHPQLDYLKPLLKKGIVSGKNDKLKTLILDCAVYAGNSGGPVLQVDWSKDLSGVSYQVVGVVSEYIPYETKGRTKQRKRLTLGKENSGYSVAVPMDAVRELLPQAMEVPPSV